MHGKNKSYITVKDNHDSFPEESYFRLINTSKSDIGKFITTIVY